MTALALAERALAVAGTRSAEAVVHTESSVFARFAGAEIHQPTLIDNALVQLTVFREGRRGFAVTNRSGDVALRGLVTRADEAAAQAEPDPAASGPADAFDVPRVEGYDPATAALPPERAAELAASAIDAAAGFGVYGYFTSGACELALATSRGARATQRFTDATAVVLAAADGASGYAAASAWTAGTLDPAAVARDAVAKAERTRGASVLAPGVYRAVLEPYAVGELLQWFAYSAFSGLAVLEERSYLSGRIGERLFGREISIVDDALDPRGFPKAFDFEGTPKRRVPLVENGVAAGAVWDRATAARAGGAQRSTGHAAAAPQRSDGPLPLALTLAPGDAESAAELAERVGDGIYVTRVHYVGIVDPREGILTGMTRDGTFRIRDGRVAEPLVNLRFTISMPEVLREAIGLSNQQKLVNQSDFYEERYPFGALVPALATAHFAVTGTGAAPGL